MGFSWKATSKTGGYWEKDCQDNEIKKVERFCRRKRLKVVVYEKHYSRGDHYRKTFFDANHGIFGNGNYYWCAYCGKIISRKKVTVDHIVPVDKVLQGDRKEHYRRMLRRRGITDVNQKKNLVAACWPCNRKKSANTGLWILKGRIGRFGWLWVIRWIFRIWMITAIVCLVIGYDIIPILTQHIPEGPRKVVDAMNVGTLAVGQRIAEGLKLLHAGILTGLANSPLRH